VSSTQLIRFVLKPIAFVAALGPVAWLVWAGLTGNLSVDPLADLTNETGLWTLRFICITLAVTPVRRLTGWNELIRFRRMIGLFAFFYGSLHFLIYVIADRFAGLDFPDGFVAWSTVMNLAKSVASDVYKRPFITIGFTTLMLLLPLAVTSTAGWIRRLGGKQWQTLHRLIYVAGITAILHYWWLVKADVTSPQRYAIAIGVLLVFRLAWARRRAGRPASAQPRQQPVAPSRP
jgi:methionine sulfoxide reductase heme-binding subunit